MTRDTPPLPATPEVCRTPPRFCPEGVGVGLPTIWREAAANPANVLYLTRPRCLDLLPVPGRSRASTAPTACGQNQKRSAYRLYQSGLQSESKALGVSVVEVGALGVQHLRCDSGCPAFARKTGSMAG